MPERISITISGSTTTLNSMTRPPPGLNTIGKRLEWVLKERGFSRRGLSLKAGLTDTHVGTIIRSDLQHVQVETTRRLAIAAGVSLRWLATGEGRWDDVASPVGDMPAREWAIEVLRGGGVSEDVIQELVHEQHDEEHDRFWWLERGVMMARLRGPVTKNKPKK